jgi:tRNA G18 (ribose-2'-O)-methylase SpoU
MTHIIVIAHNLRSTHNVGSLIRTCEGLGINRLYFTGYTPYPLSNNDPRMPHLAQKIDKQIHKTALGAELDLDWKHIDDIEQLITDLKSDNFVICGLEQDKSSMNLADFTPPERIALILGREVEGIEASVIELCDQLIEIPMFGKKESFNVVQAAAMTLYHLVSAGMR